MSWINNNYQPSGAGLWQQNGYDAEAAGFGGYNAGSPTAAAGGADGYQPPWWGGNNALGNFSPNASQSPGGINAMLGQIVNLLQQLLGSLGGGSSAAGSQFCGSANAQPFGSATFSNATLSSTGDPHLALSGTEQNANGTTSQINDRYDNMTSQRDLLSTNDFGNAFRVSTTASQPNASGVTYNASASASMNFGRDRVTMGAGGAVSVISNGTPVNLAAGQSVTLSGGAVVRENANGSVSIAQQNGNGEALTTTFAYNGSGVDVNATASGGVTLGGSLVRHATGAAG
jgi:hypothetical protein